MLVGELIDQFNTATYTAQYPTLGSTGAYAIEIVKFGGSTTGALRIDVEHRNVVNDSWTIAGSLTGLTTTGLHSVTINILKALWRYKMVVSGGSTEAWIRVVFIVPPRWS